jgi:hypothetical protein
MTRRANRCWFLTILGGGDGIDHVQLVLGGGAANVIQSLVKLFLASLRNRESEGKVILTIKDALMQH